jgi:hypothetical protein
MAFREVLVTQVREVLRAWLEPSPSVPRAPSGRRACGKIGRGRSPTSSVLGAGETVCQFDAGGRFEGLRIVATSTCGSDSSVPLRPLRATTPIGSYYWQRS